jgi:hypothetical protein
MKAFVEILAGLVRVGPEAEKYGDPFELSVAFSGDGEVATIKGLVSNGAMKPSHYRAGKKALEALGLKVRRERKRKRAP